MNARNRTGVLCNRVSAPLSAALLLAAGAAHSADFNFTLDTQFDSGTLNGVNHNAPNNNQLQLNATGTTFPVLWIANAGEDTVSRIDTDVPSAFIPSGGCETARYRTWFQQPVHGAWSGPAPSRTAVDIDGNVYVANRHFDGRPAEVMKILAEGGIDRNGNGVIDTSIDANGDCQIQASEIKPLTDTNGNNIVDPNEIQDERVAWIKQVGPNNGLGRSLCIGTDGNIWAGLYNSRQYYKLSALDGSILAGPIATDVTPYGCLVDGDGTLWSADLGSSLGELDTNIPASQPAHSHGAFGGNYGIALGNGKVYLANQSSRSYTQYDPASNTFSTPAASWTYTLGISVDGNGNIVLGTNPFYKFAPDGSVIWSTPNPFGFTDVRGVVPDSNNDIWAVQLSNNNVIKLRGTDGAYLGALPVGSSPYTYSDATGFAARNVTTPSGIWNVTANSGAAGTQWDKIVWNTEPQGSIPAGASITVDVRAADTLALLASAPFVTVGNGASLAAFSGQYIGIRATLKPTPGGITPVLSDLKVSSVSQDGQKCDVDKDGDIDKNDLSLISRARGQTALPGDPRDSDNDGKITPNDVKVCIPLCTRASCAIQ